MSHSKQHQRTPHSSRPTASEDATRAGGTWTRASREAASLKISDPAARRDLAALQKSITRSPKEAGAFLRDAGLITPTGKLPKKFGG
jgi:hypothetical protein